MREDAGSTEVKSTTWHSQVLIDNPVGLMAALRAAGLPLANTSDAVDEESNQSGLVCIAEVRQESIHAVVASPSGHVYRFEPSSFEQSFWSFAARNYYWVTGCMADREQVSKLTEVPVKSIKGRTLSRTKLDLSGMTLNDILGELGYKPTTGQGGLFE